VVLLLYLQWQRSGWSLILTKHVVFGLSLLIEIHRMIAFVPFEASYFLTVDADSAVFK